MITDEHLGTATTEQLTLVRPRILEGTTIEEALERDKIDVEGTRSAVRRCIGEHQIEASDPEDVPAYTAGFYDGLAIGVRAARLESFA